jgi:hypothetical protein
MWNIADSGEIAAAESFQKRFPELKHELAKRMNLVADIKKAKALHMAVPVRPEFRLKQRAQSNGFKPSGRLVASTAFVLGAALVFAVSYTIMKVRNAPAPQQTSPGLPSCLTPKAPAHPPTYNSQINSKERLVPYSTDTQMTKPLPPSIKDHASEQLDENGNGPVPVESTPEEIGPKPQRMIMKQVHLSDALHAISSQYGLKIQTAPGFPDPTIDLDTQEKDALGILRDIGTKYGFGVVEEGDKSVLLVQQTKTQ